MPSAAVDRRLGRKFEERAKAAAASQQIHNDSLISRLTIIETGYRFENR
jgi:hypothetical protein